MELDLGGIGKITRLLFDDRKLYITMELNGLEGQPIDIACDSLKIAEDGSSLEFSGLASNTPFVHNALNRFLPPQVKIPESGRQGVLLVKQLLGI